MKYGLSKVTIDKICGVFAQFPEVQKAVLYGSRAKGNYKTGSDIDLTLYGTELTLQLRDDIADALDDLLLPYLIDLSIFDELENDKLREHITRVGVVFYEGENKADLKSGWEVKRLGEVCERITDGSHNPPKGIDFSDYLMLSSKNIIDDGIILDSPRYLTEADFINENKRTDVKAGDVLLTIVGTIGRIAIIPENFPKFTLQRSVAVLKNKSDIVSSRFLMLSLQNIFDEMSNQARGVAQKGLYLNQIKNLEILIPPLHEQQQIVAILDEAFAAIDKAKENAQKNLKNARELFESYLQSVFANAGEGWEEDRLGDVCSFEKTPNKRTDLPYVGMEDIESNSGKFIGSTTPQRVKSLTFYFTPEHVLYGRLRPYLNKVLLPTFEGHCSTEVFPLKPKNGLSRNFLFRWLLSSQIVERINATCTGARMPRANMNAVLEFMIPIPSLQEQKRIVTKLDSLSLETKKLETIYKQKLLALDELKKSLLQKAFNGQLTATPANIKRVQA